MLSDYKIICLEAQETAGFKQRQFTSGLEVNVPSSDTPSWSPKQQSPEMRGARLRDLPLVSLV